MENMTQIMSGFLTAYCRLSTMVMKLCHIPALHCQLNHLEWQKYVVLWNDINSLLENTGAEVYTGHLPYLQYIFSISRKPVETEIFLFNMQSMDYEPSDSFVYSKWLQDLDVSYLSASK